MVVYKWWLCLVGVSFFKKKMFWFFNFLKFLILEIVCYVIRGRYYFRVKNLGI